MCGDSTKDVMIEELLKAVEPTLCVTDPPYGVNYQSKAKERTALFKLKVQNDHIANWGEAFRLSKAPVLYCWFSFKHWEIVCRALFDAGYQPNQNIVWVKERFSLQRHLYHLQHENCTVAHKANVKVTDYWVGDRKQRSVWQVPRVPQKKKIHATEKPIEVYDIPIQNHTREGDVVVDMFAGSGVLFEACEKTKRKGYGVELCVENCNLILNRMNNLGLKIEKERNIFDD